MKQKSFFNEAEPPPPFSPSSFSRRPTKEIREWGPPRLSVPPN